MNSAPAGGCQGCGKTPYSNRTLLVRRPSDLHALLRSRQPIECIALDEALPPSPEATNAIARLFHLYEECGCVAGGIAFFAALIASVALALFGFLPLSFRSLGYAFAVCIGSAVAGKLLMLGVSRWQMRRQIRNLISRWEYLFPIPSVTEQPVS